MDALLWWLVHAPDWQLQDATLLGFLTLTILIYTMIPKRRRHEIPSTTEEIPEDQLHEQSMEPEAPGQRQRKHLWPLWRTHNIDEGRNDRSHSPAE